MRRIKVLLGFLYASTMIFVFKQHLSISYLHLPSTLSKTFEIDISDPLIVNQHTNSIAEKQKFGSSNLTPELVVERNQSAFLNKSTAFNQSSVVQLYHHPPECFIHPPSVCRYDEVGKYLEQSAKFTIVHKPSDAVPEQRRIPSNQAGNTTYILERRLKGPADGSLTALTEYNPSLLPLTDDLDPVLLNYLTGRYHKDISDEEADQVKYLSISRGGNFHACVPGLRRMYNPTMEHSYLTLVLLDAYLNPIPKASASVRLSQAFFPKHCSKRLTMDCFQDFQIIAARSSKGNNKKDQLFVIASDIHSYIFPIDIRRVPNRTNEYSDWNTKIKGKSVPMILNDAADSYEQIQFYGEGIQVRLMEYSKKKFCTTALIHFSLDWQKNYHVFDVERNGTIKTYMELRPHYRREVREINFLAERFHEVTDWELVPNGTMISQNNGHRDESDIIVSVDSLNGNWNYPNNEITQWKRGSKLTRGTACCLDIVLIDSNQTVKVGISHAVSTPERSYVSRFYAFETQSNDFKIVALSGPFCLSHASAHDINFDTVTMIQNVNDRMMTLGGEIYDCPTISFLSGLVEYQADQNYAVLSYGVDDCYSRSIVISKAAIKEFLGLH